MSTPVIAFTNLAGTDGGPAPHHFSVAIDWDNSTIGSGRNDEAFIEWRVLVGGVAPTTRISCTDPIDGTTTRYLDADQHGANFNYLALDVGTHVVQCRVTNSAGERTAWLDVVTVTTTARNPSLVCYVDGARIDDTGDGLSWETAKKTWNAGLVLLNSLGDGSTMRWRSCATTTSTQVTADNVLIEAEDDDQILTIGSGHGSNHVTPREGSN